MRKIIPILGVIVLFAGCGFFSPGKPHCVLVGSVDVTTDQEGDIEFLGTIKNDGGGKAYFVKITFTTKDAEGNVLGVDTSGVEDTHISPGLTSDFDCKTDVPRGDVDSWDYEIDWTEH